MYKNIRNSPKQKILTFSVEQIEQIHNFQLPRAVKNPYSGEYDNGNIDTKDDIWRVSLSGHPFKFNFIEHELRPLTTSHTQFLKWVTALFLKSYHAGYSYALYKTLLRYLRSHSSLSFNTAKLYLESMSNDSSSVNFLCFKRFILLLCEYEIVGFNPESLYDLETILPPQDRNWENYYNLDFKLKSFENKFIRNGIVKASLNVHNLQFHELLDLVTLSICFETGLRTGQLFNLSDSNFLKHSEGFYALRIPFAKKSLKQREQIIIKISNELACLIEALLKMRSTDDGSTQLVRKHDGVSISYQKIIIDRINRAISRFLPDVPSSELPHLTPYDFRHNVAHNLAMSGASADEISYILGHTTTVVARHYISATPEIAVIKQKALGGNKAYLEMMGMIMTGKVVNADRWASKKVAGQVNGELFVGIGGCSSHGCPYSPVRSCYGCEDFNPFADADHQCVRDAVQSEIITLLELTDSTGQTRNSPLITEHEATLFEIDTVIARCNMYKDGIENA